MSKIKQMTCPGCDTQGTLSIVLEKGRYPVLRCGATYCTFSVTGRIEAGKAVFDAGATA